MKKAIVFGIVFVFLLTAVFVSGGYDPNLLNPPEEDNGDQTEVTPNVDDGNNDAGQTTKTVTLPNWGDFEIPAGIDATGKGVYDYLERTYGKDRTQSFLADQLFKDVPEEELEARITAFSTDTSPLSEQTAEKTKEEKENDNKVNYFGILANQRKGIMLNQVYEMSEEDQAAFENIKKEYYSDIWGRIGSSFISPGRGASAIGAWFTDITGSRTDISKLSDNSDSFIFTILDPSTTLTDQFCRSVHNDPSEFFEQEYAGHYASGEFPSPDGSQVRFIYGKRTEYRELDGDSAGRPLYNWPAFENDDTPAWFPNPNGTALGYLYKFSWNFKHPFTKDEIDDMDEMDRADEGLDRETGNLTFRVILKSQDDTSKGRDRFLEAGATTSETVSFYTKQKITGVCLQFDGFRLDDNRYYPKDCEPSGNIGEVKIALSDSEGFVWTPLGTDVSGFYPGGAVPVGGGAGWSPGSDLGDFDGRI